MAETLYKDTTYPVSLLVELIKTGKIALPDIQRPFVWQATKVRALFDSMYKGFPVGYLLFWDTGAEVGARQIGVDTVKTVPTHLIVDGQQRLTSLFAVMTGATVLHDDYSESRIRIAFRPTDATFAVTDAAIEKDPEFIPDISVLWQQGGKRATTKAYLKTLSARREVDDAEEERLEEAIDRLYDLQHYPFKVIELSAAADEEQVAEIFVRINSEGVALVQADFILTLMSVFWEKGRRDLEDFCRVCRVPSLGGASPFNWYIQPQPPQLLRATVAVAMRRAVLRQIYVLLRGKDVETGKPSPELRDAQFAKLAQAQEHVLNLTHWHEFLLCLERAGFRGKKMISSENAIIFSYAIWLIGRVDYRVPIARLREVMARWFFMAHTTGRYSGSFESQVERDLAQFNGLAEGDADGFVAVLSKIVKDTLTTDYWEIRLPNELDSSAAKSPALLAYIAALNIVDADALLSTGKVRARLDPAVTVKKGIERHHLFPRAYLRKQGITGTKKINQIANMALVEWYDNITISDQPPAQYWPDQVRQKNLHQAALDEQLRWHALPDKWTELSYDAFLAQRRKLMAGVVRDAFNRLTDSGYSPVYPKAGTPTEVPAPTRTWYGVRVVDLIDAGLLPVEAVLINPTDDVEARILTDGRIEFDGLPYDSPSGASDVAHGSSTNGWAYWLADTPAGLRPLAALRDELRKTEDGEEG
ncbi:GmrSD restriction endonuclease domain-containing protein [Micromonospora sp. WMMD754]|uniref:GmrSD restriction endonuclease domain-containing protein n=1 Tax=Micromonospora sp. WMMD754 TaxID=3404114 RepID=UPI003BF6134C